MLIDDHYLQLKVAANDDWFTVYWAARQLDASIHNVQRYLKIWQDHGLVKRRKVHGLLINSMWRFK